ncbi:MAG: hypothetical protein Q9195_004921 [Heterodermia aff. obscurata]
MEHVEVRVLTFNCARELVKPEVFARHIFDASPPSLPPEILIISLQEIAPITYSFLGGSFLLPYFDRVRHSVNIAAGSFENASYNNIITSNVGMTAISAFVLQDKTRNMKWIESAGVGVGVYGMGNKGAVALRLGYAVGDEELELSIIAGHLAAMENALSRRNEDWANICRGLVFTPVREGVVRSSTAQRRSSMDVGDDNAPLLQKTTSNSTERPSGLFNPKSHIILAGDLNYRTSRLKPSPTDYHLFPQPCKDQTNPRHYSNLLKEDQLSREMEAQRTCHGLQEAPIDFPPTYKYSDKQRAVAEKDDELRWDWAKHRWPSWCDRILYTDLPFWMKAADPSVSIKAHDYTALPLMSTSDHRPVALSLSIPAKAIPTPDSDQSGDDARLSPPFELDEDWRSKRADARRRELVVGSFAYLGLTWEGRSILLATVIGVLTGWWIMSSLLGVS